MAQNHRAIFISLILITSSILLILNDIEVNLKPTLESEFESLEVSGPYTGTQSFTSDWIFDGVKQGVYLSNNQSWVGDLTAMPNGHVAPNYVNQTPTGGWSYFENFSSWSGGKPVGWDCGGGGFTSQSGAIQVGFSATEPAGYNGWCREDLGTTHNFNLSYQNYSTFETLLAVSDGRSHQWQGSMIHSTFDDKRTFISLVLDSSGNLVPVNGDFRDSALLGNPCATQNTLLPQPDSNWEYHTYRTIADSSLNKAWLYQDGILRCQISLSNIVSSYHDNDTAVSTYGGGGDSGWARHDHNAMNGGVFAFQSDARWISPTINSMNHYWENFNFDWWAGGIGNSTMMSDALTISVIDSSTSMVIPGFANIPMPDGVLNLSAIPYSTAIKVRIDWHEGMYDMFSIGNFSITRGDKIDYDLYPSDISLDNPGLVRVGDTIQWSGIANIIGSTAQSVASIDQILIDNIVIAENTVDYSTISSNTSVSGNYSGAISSGIHTIFMSLDTQGSSNEAVETNNQMSRSILIHPNSGPVIQFPNGAIFNSTDVAKILVLDQVDGYLITMLTIDWGDGMTEVINGQGPFNLQHNYSDVDMYQISASASLEYNLISTITTENLIVLNEGPLAIISTIGEWSKKGATTYFGCGDSIDPENGILICDWTIDGGAAGTGETFGWAFDQIGTFTIGLTVTDEHGGIDYTSKEWDVAFSNQEEFVLEIIVEPTALPVYEGAGIDIQIIWNQELPLDYSNNAVLTWKIDGVNSPAQSISDAIYRFEAPTSNTTVQVSLSIQFVDSYNQLHLDSDQLIVDVVNRNPTPIVVINTVSIIEGEYLLIDWSSSHDDDWDMASLFAEFELDGSPITLEEVSAGIVHLYVNQSGEHTITVIIRDGKGGSALTDMDFLVINRIPSAIISCSVNQVTLNQSFTCGAIDLNDTVNDLDGLILKWTFSDGTQTITADSINHFFTEYGTHHIGLIITDDDDAASTSNMSFNIVDPNAPTEGSKDNGNGNGAGGIGEEDNLPKLSFSNPLVIFLIALVVIIIIGVILIITVKANKNPQSKWDQQDNAWFDQSSEVLDQESKTAIPIENYQPGGDGYYYKVDPDGSWVEGGAYVQNTDGSFVPYQE